jgi:hypothetical protein
MLRAAASRWKDRKDYVIAKMKRSPRSATSALLPLATAALAAGIFAAEAITSTKLTAAIFYVLVVLLAARFCSARGIVLVGVGCVGLTMLAFFLPGFTGTKAGGAGVKASISAAVVGLAAIEEARLCSNDPVCAEHDASAEHDPMHLIGASCHGCLLIAETSCEQRNDWLDRALVVPTLAVTDAAFFP